MEDLTGFDTERLHSPRRLFVADQHAACDCFRRGRGYGFRLGWARASKQGMSSCFPASAARLG